MIRLTNPATGELRDFKDFETTAVRILQEAGWLRIEPTQESAQPAPLMPEMEMAESGIPPAKGPLEPLPKSMPGYPALVKAGIYSLDEMRGMGEAELEAIPGIGKRTASKIVQRVELHYANRSAT